MELNAVFIHGSSLTLPITLRSAFLYRSSFIHAEHVYQSFVGNNPGQGSVSLSEMPDSKDKT